MEKITATIKLGDEYELNLSAKSMNELVDKIIEWQDFENNKDLLPKKNFKKQWYYFKNKQSWHNTQQSSI